MTDLFEFPWKFSFISWILSAVQILRKIIAMGMSSNSPSSPSIGFSFSRLRSRAFGPSSSFMNDDLCLDPPRKIQRGLGLQSEENSLTNLSGRKKSEEILPLSNPQGRPKNSSSVRRERKRPAKIAIPESVYFAETEKDCGIKEFDIEERDYFLACKRGKREVMEDGYQVITDISGDEKQAYFGVFDGHGGRAAVDYVAENLGQNMITVIREMKEEENALEKAIKSGYLKTDQGFLKKGIGSGACAATAILGEGELHVANVGDCRVVLSRNGVADVLTSDHRVDREDERNRIENSGAFVSSHHGVWRVHGTLALSRAIGDIHMKEWIIAEPEMKKIELTLDCEFLIMASDGLWDKVTNQEAVDVVSKQRNSIESCKKLIEISSSRGNFDDVTVMVVNLRRFKQNG